jgi:antitoxin FitA
MGQMLIRKLDDKVIKKIKVRAKANGRSAEAEVRDILIRAVEGGPVRSGPSLVDLMGAGRHTGRTAEEIDRHIRELRDEWR